MYAKSNPSDARVNNRRLLFQLLFPGRQLSRADLCKETGLSRATATDVTGEMIDDGLLRELGSGPRDGRGKPGILLAIDTNALRLVCVDLSRPYVMTGAVMDLRARIVERRERVLDDGDRVDLDDVLSLVGQMVQLAGPGLAGIGVAVPGVISGSGTVISSPWPFSECCQRHSEAQPSAHSSVDGFSTETIVRSGTSRHSSERWRRTSSRKGKQS